MPAPAFAMDLEERKTVWRLLDRLDETQRVAWLLWCCSQVSTKNRKTIITHTSGTTTDVYHDWLSLCTCLGLGWKTSRAELEARVRKFGKPLFFAAGGASSLLQL